MDKEQVIAKPNQALENEYAGASVIVTIPL